MGINIVKITKTSKTLIEKILKYGLCFEILSDQGLEFGANLSLELYKMLGINKIRTSAYGASTNGAVTMPPGILVVWGKTTVSTRSSDDPLT